MLARFYNKPPLSKKRDSFLIGNVSRKFFASALITSFAITVYACEAHLPSSTAAPGRGEMPEIAQHYQARPSFYDFENMPAEEVAPGVKRRFIMGAQAMIVRWDLAKNTVLPTHFHPNEQISRVEKGVIVAYSKERKYVLTPGQYMIFPANVPHEFVAQEEASLIEVFAPLRQDFLSGGAGGIPLPPQ